MHSASLAWRRRVAVGLLQQAQTASIAIPLASTPSEENGAEGKETAHLDPEQLKELTNDRLRELAEDMGINPGKLKTKAQLIDAITAVEVAPGEDALPVFGAEAPVV